MSKDNFFSIIPPNLHKPTIFNLDITAYIHRFNKVASVAQLGRAFPW